MTEKEKRSLNGIKVLCVGAGIEQLPAIQMARQMGLYVIAIDGNPTAEGLLTADEGIVLDLKDTETIIQLAAQTGIHAILPVPLGSILTTVGAVNDALGLKGISEIAAQRCTNKYLTHKIFVEAGIPTVDFIEAVDETDLLNATQSLGFPAVVKPCFGSGSKGVFVARSIAELQHLMPWHLNQRPKNNPARSIVERFVAGQEVGVDGVIVDNQYVPLLIRDKAVTDLPFRLPYAYFAPTHLTPSRQQLVHTVLAKAVAALDLRNCLIHADVILAEDGQAYVIDISGRPSGFNLSTKMVPAAIGIHPIQQMVQLTLGQAAVFQPSYQRGAILQMLDAPSGYLKAVEGIEQVSQLPGVMAVETFLKPGDFIQERRNGATGYQVGYLLTAAETRSQAELLWHQAAQKIHFHVKDQG